MRFLFQRIEKQDNSKEHFSFEFTKVMSPETKQDKVFETVSIEVCDAGLDDLNLLFIGDTNRIVCETPRIDTSTTSHCIFIIMNQ